MKETEISRKIKVIRFTRLIFDPFPAETKEHRYRRLTPRKMWERLFGKEEKPKISIWEAYRRGYDQAYEEIVHELEKE